MKKTVMEVAQELDYLVRARYPVIAVQTYEEQRVLSVAKKIAFSRNKELYLWNCNRGLMHVTEHGDTVQDLSDGGLTQPQQILSHVEACKNDAVFVLQDFQVFIGKNPKIDRQVKDLVEALHQSRKTVIITGTHIEVPSDLDKYITLLDFPMPDREVLREALDDLIDRVSGMDSNVTVRLTDADREELVEAAKGLTVSETKLAAAKTVVATGRIDSDSARSIIQEKRQIIRKSGTLEFYPASEDLADIGGLDALKEYIQERDHWWNQEVLDFGLKYLKGVVLIGVPGSGKSLTAKTMASHWGLPLIRLDMSRIFDKYVGGSEENIRKAMHVAEAVAPCVLWLDEVEKAMATGSGDNGTSRRVLGQFLTWMQEKESPVFVVCTANKVTGDGGLPPEFLRKGRFDELWFVDLPTLEERAEIVDIHLRKKGREFAREDVERIAEEADGYTGAEIEAALEAALWKCYSAKTELTAEMFIESLKRSTPLKDTMSQELAATREWAKGRVRYASNAAGATVMSEAEQSIQLEIE